MATFKFVPPGTIKQGYLVKSPPLDKKIRIDGWKKRWCVFTIVERDPSLDYYKDEEEALNTLPIKRISLMNCSQVISDMKHKSRKHVFALHLPKRVYYFAAPSRLEMTEWVDAFSDNLKLNTVDGSTLPFFSTPPLHRAFLDDAKKSATLPAGLATPPAFPRTRTPDSPLPPIPVSPEMSPRPRRPAFPLPTIPTEATTLSTHSTPSLRSSSPVNNNYFEIDSSSSEGSKVSLSVKHPPAPPPHKSLKSTRSSSEEEDDIQVKVLPPPIPPPRRASPVPSDLSPPLSPPFEMDGDFPPPTPPPRTVGDSPSHHSISSVS